MALTQQHPGTILGLAGLGLLGALLALVWPVAAVGLAGAVLLCAVALRAPALGLVGGLLIAGSEGLFKARLNAESFPSANGAGAIALDVLLAAVAVWLCTRAGRRPFVAVWREATRGERIAWALVGAWLVVSAIQVLTSPDLTNAVEGLRLTQAYVLLILAGLVLYAVHPSELAVTRGLLVAFAVLAGYAAFRALVDPSSWELAYLLDRSPHARLGTLVRDAGTFSTAVALASFLVPVAVFSMAIGLLDRRVRVLAWVTCALALVAIVDSYARTAILGLVVGAGLMAFMLLAGREIPRRTKLLVVAAVLVLGAGVYAAAMAAGRQDSITERRAEGLSDPLGDRSLEIRWRTWRHSVDTLASHPFGTGIGTVGHATTTEDRRLRGLKYTDNSYLKVLQEQGIAGALFVVGVIAATALVIRRLVRAGPAQRPLGVAAVAAVVSFLVLCLLQEYIELAGKVVAWTMLGVAVASAFGLTRAGQATGARERDGVHAA
jgi:O-antigen ligase